MLPDYTEWCSSLIVSMQNSLSVHGNENELSMNSVSLECSLTVHRYLCLGILSRSAAFHYRDNAIQESKFQRGGLALFRFIGCDLNGDTQHSQCHQTRDSGIILIRSFETF